MNGKVSFHWVNKGEPFVLPGLPIAGHEATIEKRYEHIKFKTEYHNANRLILQTHLVTAKKVADAGHYEESKRYFMREVAAKVTEDPRELDWPLDQYATRLDGWYDEYVAKPLAAPDAEAAIYEINKQLNDVDMASLGKDLEMHNIDIFLLELWWRLKGKFKTLDNGEDFSIENLREVVVWPEDGETFYGALARKKPDENETLMEALTAKDEDAIAKN